MNIQLTNFFTDQLPADPNLENTRREVLEAVYSFVRPIKTSNPTLLHVSDEMQHTLDFSNEDIQSREFLEFVTGNSVLKNSKPFAMCYAGHQFGNWAGQLGDGRAINLGEIKDWAVQLKGSGPTPYSRTADGLAVLRSSVREYLCSEAMHHLGVPSTRALSLSLTGDKVLRDVMYNGNPAHEKGAIVSRVAKSFLRFGNFEIFSSRNDIKNLKILTDYTIKSHFSHLGKPSKEVYLQFFQEVSSKTLEMIIHWQRVGFVHGVMNTDNMSILGLTIDYGPYGWLEGFDFGWTPNTTDKQHKRYRYGNQPTIGLWNLYQLANALYPLIEEAAPLEKILEDYKSNFEKKSQDMMRAKLGLTSDKETDINIIQSLENNLQATETDMTIFFRTLSSFKKEQPEKGVELIQDAFYTPDTIKGNVLNNWKQWFANYAKRLEDETTSADERQQQMNKVNPKYVLRNYMAQLAIDKADKGDTSLLEEMYLLLKEPYSEQPKFEHWFAKRPEWARHKVGCSMLSCSS
ncbi:YdiU family protein [bacterium]|nr:YdiU family protein [bacterium]MDA9327906.1 YdiU family protein [Flavobacteriaceae bacterium]MDB4192404.1 YdiU family protein [Flavobacteriaceae bacterium]MDB9893510.1 YdiU family protein [Flavobacteriaceae bacterium]MDB9955664.1 YdiU family protein [Flavobacteriaceae bacterium]